MIALGTVGDYECVLTQKHFSTHMLLTGRTGQGKSELLRLISVQRFKDGRGFCMTDSDGKTARMTYLSCMEVGTRAEQDSILYLRPSCESTFRFDPFQTTYTGFKRTCWMYRRVEEIGQIIGRKQGLADYKEQPRRERFLKDVLYFVGTPVKGKYMGLSRALDALDIGTKAWDRWFQGIAPELPPPIRYDWQALRAMSYRDRGFFLESTINILRQFMGPLVTAMTQPGPSIDFHDAINRKLALIVDLEESDTSSREECEAIAGIIINEVMEAQYSSRSPYMLLIDEVDRVLGEDLADAFARARKRNLSLVVSGQSFNSFENRFTDMADRVLSQAGIVVSFQQKGGKDTEALARYFARPNWTFERDYRPIDRPDGYEIVEIDEYSESEGESESKSAAFNWGKTHGWDFGIDQSKSNTATLGSQKSEGETDGEGESEDKSETKTKSRARGFMEDKNGERDSVTNTDADAVGSRKGKSRKHDVSRGSAVTATEAEGTQVGTKNGISGGEQSGGSLATTSQKQASRAVSHKKQLVPKYREELIDTGIRTPLDQQSAGMEQALHRLSQAQAIVSVWNGKSFLLDVHRVTAPRVTREEIEDYFSRLPRLFPFLFTPETKSLPEPQPTDERLGTL